MPLPRTSLIVLAALLAPVAAGAADVPKEGAWASREQLRECLDTEDALKARLQAIQSANAEHQKTWARIDAESDQIRATGAKMNEMNPTSAMSYDAMVKSHNLRVRELNQAEAALVPVSDAYNADMGAFHARCAGISYRAEDMDAVVQDRRKAAAGSLAASAP